MRPREHAALLVTAALTALSFLTVCDLIFACGCVPPWAGAADHCDIVRAGLPDCPFCAGGAARFTLIAAILVAAELLAILVVSRLRETRLVGLVAAGLCGYLVAT